MTEMFKVGDRVHHSGRNETGTVLPFTETGVIRVEFDLPTPRHGRCIGEFDAIWFKSHPGWLRLLPRNPQGSGDND